MRKQGGDGGDAARADIGDARCLPLSPGAPSTSPSTEQKQGLAHTPDASDAKDETIH